MADIKLNNPKVVGKLKLPAEVASKALQVSATGELETSTVSTAELAYLSGVTSSVQTQISAKADSSALTTHTSDVNNPHAVTKTQVGLGNVDNTSDATKNSAVATLTNKTIDAASNTISNIANANISASAAIVESKLSLDFSTSSLNTAIAGKISSTEKGAANGVATLGADSKIPAAQIPSISIIDTFVIASEVAMLALTAQKGDVAIRSDLSKTFILQGTDPTILSNWVELQTPASPVQSVNSQIGNVVLTKSDVGLGNVDNTSDATKNSAVATLTNKTISATNNTISDIAVANLAVGVIDTDLTTVSGADDTIPSAKATKAYVDSKIGASGVTGDIALTTFSAANNQAVAADVTGLAFSAASVRGFKALVTVAIDATAGLNEVFELTGVQLASGFVLASSSVGDDAGIVFSITSAGQVQYTSTNIAGFVSNKISFRAQVTNV